MAPHTMLSGDNVVQVNAGSSDNEAHHQQNKLQISESVLSYQHAGPQHHSKINMFAAREAYHARGRQPHSGKSSVNMHVQRSNSRNKPPRSTSMQMNKQRGSHRAASSTVEENAVIMTESGVSSRPLSISSSGHHRNGTIQEKELSLLQRVLSPNSSSTRRRQGPGFFQPNASLMATRLPPGVVTTNALGTQIHQVPTSIMERNSIDKLNRENHLTAQQMR